MEEVLERIEELGGRTTVKCCTLATAGPSHLQTHSSCGCLHKASQGQDNQNSSMDRGESHKASPLGEKLAGESFFFMGVATGGC